MSAHTDKKINVAGGTLELDYHNDVTNNTLGTPSWVFDKVRVYIPSPTGNVGTAELDPSATNEDEHSYLVYHYDHLGSIQAITSYGETSQNINTMFANDAVGRESLYSYDAWGQRRDPKDWNGFPWTQTATAPVTTWAWDNPATPRDTADEDDLIPRGFTGHEMLDPLGLINMNGRIYCAQFSLFCSADPLVQNPANHLSYNRYSYCMNSPLGYVDPSGYQRTETYGFSRNLSLSALGTYFCRVFEFGAGGQTTTDGHGFATSYSPPEGGVGGVSGGVIRAVTLRLAPVEANPSFLSKAGMEVGGSLVPVADGMQSAITGESVSGRQLSAFERLVCGVSALVEIQGVKAAWQASRAPSLLKVDSAAAPSRLGAISEVPSSPTAAQVADGARGGVRAAESGPSLDALSQAAGVADRGGLTAAGRSLTKHGAGARTGNNLFPAATGNPATINQTAQNVVDDILTTPGSTVQNSARGRFGITIEVTAPDGRGMVYDANGNFLFFKE